MENVRKSFGMELNIFFLLFSTICDADNYYYPKMKCPMPNVFKMIANSSDSKNKLLSLNLMVSRFSCVYTCVQEALSRRFSLFAYQYNIFRW